jgi:ribonuclease D
MPAETAAWLNQFKARILLEKSCIQLLIRWGLTENAFDIYRVIEERLASASERHWDMHSGAGRSLNESDKNFLRETLRDYYARTRDFPRKRPLKELLHNGLLTGFETLINQMDQLFEQYTEGNRKCQTVKKAA